MNQEKRKLRWYHGVIILILSALCIFVISPILSYRLGLGLYGTFLNEVLLLLLALGVTALAKGDFRVVFPIRKPELAKAAGVVVLWIGSFLVMMVAMGILVVLFPRHVLEVSGGLSMQFSSVPFLISVVIVSITPAICEEAVFRGVVLNSFWTPRNKWIAIVASALLFGVFHGDPIRFVPTAFLGCVLGYILVETNNIVYTALFHAINNFVPLAVTFATSFVVKYSMGSDTAIYAMETVSNSMNVGMIGSYLMYGGVAAMFLYIGNYLLHKGQPGYQNGLFPKEKNHHLIILVTISVACLVIGLALLLGSAVLEAAREMQNAIPGHYGGGLLR